MSYPSTTLTRPMSYSDGVRILVDKEVQDDINDACSKLAYAMSTMMDKFDSIAKQMHTLDLLRHTAPLKPRWESMRKVSMPRALSRLFHIADLLKRWCANPGRGWTPLAISHERWSNFRTPKAWAFFATSKLCLLLLMRLLTTQSFAPRCCLWQRGVSMGEQEESLTTIEKVFKFCNLICQSVETWLGLSEIQPSVVFFRSRLSMPR